MQVVLLFLLLLIIIIRNKRLTDLRLDLPGFAPVGFQVGSGYPTCTVA